MNNKNKNKINSIYIKNKKQINNMYIFIELTNKK